MATLAFNELSWDLIYHKDTQSKTLFFPLSLLQEVASTSEPILFSTGVAACTIFVFMNCFLWNIGQKLINLTFVFITLVVACFPAIFKKIAHALYKQKGPCKAGQNVYKGQLVHSLSGDNNLVPLHLW